MAYTTEAKVEKYITTDISSDLSATVTDWITAVSTWIEKYCGTSFEASAGVIKYYDGNGEDRVVIDPVSAVTALEVLDENGDVDWTLIANTDFRLYPLNETVKDEIRLLTNVNSQLSTFPRGNYRVKVTGTFGTSTVPKDIELVATKLVARIIDEGLKGGKVASVSLGDYSSTFEKLDEVASAMGIFNILDQYRVMSI